MARKHATQLMDVDDPGPSQKATPEKRRDLVRDCVFYLLVANKKKQAIKKEDIRKNVLKEHRREFSTVIAEAKDALRSVYGIDLVQVKDFYILRNTLMINDINLQLKYSDLDHAKLGFLVVVLSHIFMSKGVVHESEMWPFLAQLGFDVEGKRPQKPFGDVRKFLTQELVKQMYIEHRRIEGIDPPEYEFRAGTRAMQEISKYDLLQFFCHVNSDETKPEDMKPEDWPFHYKEAMEGSGQPEGAELE